MKKTQHKKTLKNIFVLLIVFVLSFFLTHITFAQTTTGGNQKKPIDVGVQQGMLYTLLRFGGLVPDSLVKTLQWRGSAFSINPTNISQVVNAIATQAIFNTTPAKGIQNPSISKTEEMKNAGYISSAQADYLKSAGPASLSFPTGFEPLSNNTSGTGTDEIKEPEDFVNTFLSGQNRAGSNVLLTGMALGNAGNLSAAVPPAGDMLPELAKSRDIGKNNSGSTNSNGSPYNNFSGGNGQVTITSGVKNAQSALTVNLPAIAAANNPDGGQVAVNTGPMASNIGNAKAEKAITSARVSGNGSFLGKIGEILGISSNKPGSPMMDIDDIANIAAQNSADQINNQLNQINNAQNHFSNDPNLNNLQNQFSPNQFNDLLNNRFPSDGGGGSGGSGGGGTPTPPVTPTTPDTSVCDPAKAVLSQQEVTDIADFMGLTLDVSNWTISYFQASQFLRRTIYLGDSTSTQVVDQTLVPNPNACIWVVYATSAKEGAYVTDARSQTGIKFLFRMP
jgi:hypothetical protein